MERENACQYCGEPTQTHIYNGVIRFRDTCPECEQRIVDAQLPIIEEIKSLRKQIAQINTRISELYIGQQFAIEAVVKELSMLKDNQ